MRLLILPHPPLLGKKSIFASQSGLATADHFIFNEVLEALRSYSFIKRDMVNHTLSIHRLVQAVLKDEMNSETYQQWAEKAIRAVNKVFPHVEFSKWLQCERYITNAKACATLIEHGEMVFPEAALLLYKTGRILSIFRGSVAPSAWFSVSVY